MTQFMSGNPVWTKMDFVPPDNVAFSGTLEGPDENARLRTPYQYFKDLITDQMLEDTAFQTNMYTMQETGVEMKTTKKEIETFIGLYLRMGVVKANSVRAYWHEGTRYGPVADIMPRDRFLKIMKSIHFENNIAVTDDQKKGDKVWKLRPWLNNFKENLKKIPPEEHNSVDEIMVPFKGKASLKQFMRGKPHPWGFKLWGRAGASGILYDFDVYEGAKGGVRVKRGVLGLGGDVVMDMTKGLESNKNYKVFADNFFTNLHLIRALKARGILFVGTFRANRMKGLTLMTEKELKAKGRGSCDMQVDIMSNTVAVRWFDNKKVDTASSYVGLGEGGEAERWDKKEGKKVKISCPEIIKEYNRFMGGVDLLDSLTSLYKYTIKSRRWYMYLFYHTIIIAVVNSWLWYKRQAKLLKVKPVKLSVFLLDIAEALIMVKRPVGRPSSAVLTPPPAKKINRMKKSSPTLDVRLDGVGHMPVYVEKRGSCKSANCKSLTFVKCMKCEVHVCFMKERNCFVSFHMQK